MAIAREPAAQTIVVSARAERTFVGHFLAGTRVRIAVVDTQWTNAPSDELYGAAGLPGSACHTDFRSACFAPGEPVMGLILLTIAADLRDPATAGETACVPSKQIYIPDGVELAIPFDAALAFGPNDWVDGLENNGGAIEVEVERANGREAPGIERTKISVDGRVASTFAGRFTPGEYVRIRVLGGQWTNDPGAAPLGAAGLSTQACHAPGHPCVGDGAAPLMGLTLLLSACVTPNHGSLARPLMRRRHIPQGTEVVLKRDSDLYLGPNDLQNSLSDNSGSARVEVRSFPR